MSSSRLLKVEGAGNDFLLGIGEWAQCLADDEQLVQRLCHRHHGIGADGSLAIFAQSDSHLRLIYRNSDGLVARFCANGTRCAARAGTQILGLSQQHTVVTDWAEIAARVDGESVSLDLPASAAGPRQLELHTAEGQWQAELLNLGVPHLVIAVQNLSRLDLQGVAPALRRHADLGEGGANVSFVEQSTDCALDIRSWERGVEGETLCCGSAVAAAGLLCMHRSGESGITVRARSGDLLEVEALGKAPVCPSRLTGPARFIADIEPAEELLEG